MASESQWGRRLQRFGPLAAALVLAIAFFAPLFDPAVQLYYRDTGRLYYPVKLFIAQHLRQGALPLWDTMVECGVSLLGQVTPALFHPATLLYLPLPFDVAFKLNHALGPLLGGYGAYRLARRLGCSVWACLAAGVTYGGSGYLLSVTGSNLPYSLGAGSAPIAVDAVLGFVERPGVGRFAWAGAAVALIAYAGEPQAMQIAGLIALGWALAAGIRNGRALRNFGAVAACGALALCLAAPVVLPAFAELRRSNRGRELSAQQRAVFANHPLRLFGLLVPRAFDDAPEALDDRTTSWTPYTEFFATGDSAFADSIVLGAPALLFALCAAWAGRRGKLLLAGAALFALASTGEALGIDRLLFALVPGSSVFRFAEKLIAPASLLFSLATALGADRALAGSRRAAASLATGAFALAAAGAAAAAVIGAHPADLAEAIAPYGKGHALRFGLAFARELRAGLFDMAALSAVVGLCAIWRAARERRATGLALACCAASVFASCGGLLYTAPLQYVRGPFDLAEKLKARAGPSPTRWRLFVNGQSPAGFSELPARIAATVSVAQALLPQFNSVADIEGMAEYFSASDPGYIAAIQTAPEVMFDLFGVRFVVEMPGAMTAQFARAHGFRKVGFGYWVRETAVRSRAFVAAHATRVASFDQGRAWLDRTAFDARGEAIVRGDRAPSEIVGGRSTAELERLSPTRMLVHAVGPGLLVIGEHYDPGWSARIDGRDAEVLEADLAALGIVLPPGPTTVELRYRPPGFFPGLFVLLAAAGALLLAARLPAPMLQHLLERWTKRTEASR